MEKPKNGYFWGINLQFNKKGKIQLETLAIIEVKEIHTAVNFKQNLLDVFSVFCIKLWQVYSLTTDNGANNFKPVEFWVKLSQQTVTKKKKVIMLTACMKKN